MEILKTTNFIFIFIFLFTCLHSCWSIKTVSSFSQLAQHHCSMFPIELLWRISSGSISEKYGQDYFDFDCYVRQFVRKDGLVIQMESDDQQEEQSQEQEQNNNGKKQLVNDPIVAQYAQGLKKCLPQNVNAVQATYSMWRFFRFLVHNDYLYEWMRAKIRATLGYQAQRPNSWMDGQNQSKRLRLDKLFSNQFYQYIDKLMFKDFLYPLLTFFKQNTVIAISSKLSQSGKSILLQSLQTKNYIQKIFQPIILKTKNNQIFSYTIPGLPLLFAGASENVAWSFTGVLVDRSNIQQIQTVGNKYYHHDTEQWLKLDNQQIAIPGVDNKTCKFMHSSYGPLYTKFDRDGKSQEYIVRWHEKQSKVRTLFTGLYKLITNNGNLQKQQTLQFPFNSIVVTNETGIYQYLCQQFYPSYFLYPDMFGQPEQIKQRWLSYGSKKYLVISNSHLTTTKQQQYQKGQAMSPIQEQIVQNLKSSKETKYTARSLLDFWNKVVTTPQLKKQKQIVMKVYRKVKFMYLPVEQDRKKCDILISMLQKWNGNLDDKKLAPIYILWDYFLRQYTFSYISASDYAAHIVKHRLTTDNYWVNQMLLWEKGTSYGQCDCTQYQLMKDQVNGTGHNSSCYLNILRSINETKNILLQKYNGDFNKINIDDFKVKKYFDTFSTHFRGNHIQEAFGLYFSKNVLFSAQINNPQIIYYEKYDEKQRTVRLSTKSSKNTQQQIQQQL